MANLTKTSLIEKIAKELGVTKALAARFLATFQDVVVAAVKKGDKVTLTGFVSFEKKRRAERNGINPQTGAKIKIAATDYPAVKAGKAFKEAVK